MTTTQAPPEACGRCHGTGFEPVERMPAVLEDPELTAKQREVLENPELTTDQLEVLEQLSEVGLARRKVGRRRKLADLKALAQSDEDIIVHSAEATRLGLTQQQMADAVGMSRVTWWEITSGKKASGER